MDRWQEISRLYHAVRSRAQDERTAFLSDACVGDPSLRREVESLLRHEDDTENFLQRPALELAADLARGHQRMQAGQRLGPYEILAAIGAGGMGEVYKARDTRLKRPVAIKILSPEFSRDHDRRARFIREAQAIAALNHPRICIIHDVGEHDGIEYLVMEYLEGQTLRERLQEGPLPLDEALRIATEIANALCQAHEQSIVHRDLKPGNIMLTKTGAKLLDFGLAKVIHALEPDSTDTLTAPGVVLGTVAYMSPEQILGLQIDPRSDVFSFGVVLYEMATGTKPFQGANVIETIDAILHTRPAPISARNSTALARLEELISKCVEKEQQHRYQSTKELLTDLGQVNGQSAEGLSVGHRPGRRHNLPIHLTRFIGRDREIEKLQKVLNEVRLLTLTGSGGCGKTRLGLQVASEVLYRFSGGVWLVQLASVSNPELVPQTVASALGVQGDAGPLTQRLSDYLEAKQVLLFLDNCEHLVAACAKLVETLLMSCANLKILITSRQPLGASGETLWRVPSLSFPNPKKATIQVTEVSEYDAVRLFVERAQYAAPFELNELNASSVAEICHRLDGIPLAIEMAAARLNVLTVHQVAERLRDRFRLLVAHGARSLPRTQTLRDTIDWSYSLLSVPEQTLFQRLAVFAGSFSLEAVEAICSDKLLPSDDILDLLSGLVEKSIVTVDRMSGEVRYRLLETLREYGLEKLREHDGESRTRAKHSDFFAGLAERVEPELLKAHSTHWYDRIEVDHQNFLMALEWCSSLHGNSVAGLRLAAALDWFWDVRGYYGLAKRMLLQALDNDQGRAPEALRAKALDAAGYYVDLMGESDSAQRFYEQSLALWDALHDQRGVAKALWRLGVIAHKQGDRPTAESLQLRSLEVGRKLGAKENIASPLNSLGILAFDRGDYELAQSHFEESLALYRELKFEYGIAFSLFSNARLAVERADYVTADAMYTEALTLSRGLGHRHYAAQALISLGYLHADNDYARSRALYEEGLAEFRDLGLKRSVASALKQLGTLSCCEGKYDEARRLLRESREMYRQMNEEHTPNAGDAIRALGEVEFEEGRYEEALVLCQQSIQLFHDAMSGRQIALRLMGWIRLSMSDSAEALAAFRESLSLARESGRSVGLAEPYLGIGYIELLEEHCPLARSHFQEALASYEQRNNKTGIVQAVLSLGDVSLIEACNDGAMSLYERALRLAVDLSFKKGIARALRSLGTLAARQRRFDLAARRYAARDAILESINGRLPAFQSIEYDSSIANTRLELGEDQFHRLWHDGRTMSIESVLALA